MNHTRQKKLLITLLSALTLIVVAAGIIPLAISTRYEKTLQKKLPEWIAHATDSLYQLTIEDISISPFTKNVTVRGIRLIPDSTKLHQLKQAKDLPSTVYAVAIEKFEARTIHWSNLFADKEISCERFVLHQPKITVEKSDTNFTRADRITRAEIKIQRFSAAEIAIHQPDLTIKDFTRPDSLTFSLHGGNCILQDWQFNALLPEDTSLFFYARKGVVTIDSAVLKKHNSLYAFKTSNLSFTTQENTLVCTNISIEPAMSREEYQRRVVYRDEIFSLSIPKLILNGFNWQQLSKGSLLIQSVTAERPSLSIFLNRLLPKQPDKLRKFPTQILLAAKMPISIDTVRVIDGQLDYTELSNKTKREGTVPLRNLDLMLINITNIPHRILQHKECLAMLRASLFGSSLISRMQFYLDNPSGAFTARLKGGAMDGKKLNPITIPIASMEIESLNLGKADIQLHFDGHQAKSDLTFLYNDLDLKILKVTDEKELKGKGLLSFLLNKALLYPANPLPSAQVRSISTTIMRQPDQSFFNLLWSSIRKGALLTAGRNEKIADMVTARKP